jgi:hypothetical protein
MLCHKQAFTVLPSEFSTIWTNWSFWAVMTALIATILSQIPPLRILVRRGKVAAEIHSQMFIQHKFGNPSAHLHLILSNNGGRTVRVKALDLEFKNRRGNTFKLPANTYFQKTDTQNGVLFVPFNLKSGDEWAHITVFWNYLARHEDMPIRKAITVLQADLDEKHRAQTNPATWSIADDANVTPFLELFEKKFNWFPDDYEVTLLAETEPANAMIPQRFRIVIFDDDTAVLKQATEKYKYGHSIVANYPYPDGVFVQVTQN